MNILKKLEKTACKSIQTALCALLAMICVVASALAGEFWRYQKAAAVDSDDVIVADEQTETQAEIIEEAQPDYYYRNLGEFEITAYCPCSDCCGIWADGITSTGVTAKANHTIAVDPSVIPYGSVLLVNGIEYTAEDCGGAIKGKRLDIYFDTHEEALEFGRQTAETYWKVVLNDVPMQ